MNFAKRYKQLMKEAAPAVAPTRPDTAPPGRPSTTPGRPSTEPGRKNPLTPTRPNIHPRPKALHHSEDEEQNMNPDVEKFLSRRRRNKV